MKIIVGLGNPGVKYEHTRHNLGWLILDALQTNTTTDFAWSDFKEKKNRPAAISEGRHEGEKIFLIKPLTFMNHSGAAVKTMLQTTGAELTDILVVHDDLDLNLGQIKTVSNRSAAGHNGVQSIIDELGTRNFTRLRCGIGNNRAAQLPAEDYVLQKFPPADKPLVEQMIVDAITLINAWLKK